MEEYTSNFPQKVYIPRDPECPQFPNIWWEKEPSDGDVEYTRTDVFIEKACEWLTKHAKKYYFNKERYLGTEELVEDFKLSMEI